MAGFTENYEISGRLAGEWMDDQLYVVDVEKATYMILSADASYLIHQMVELGSFTAALQSYADFFGQACGRQIVADLTAKGVLVKDSDGLRPMISSRRSYDRKIPIGETAILEEGEVNKRMVASTTTMLSMTVLT